MFCLSKFIFTLFRLCIPTDDKNRCNFKTVHKKADEKGFETHFLAQISNL